MVELWDEAGGRIWLGMVDGTVVVVLCGLTAGVEPMGAWYW